LTRLEIRFSNAVIATDMLVSLRSRDPVAFQPAAVVARIELHGGVST
jgi:hypothetical protein